MREARAYASNLVLPDGRVWIAGGLGEDKVLQTSEYMVHHPTSGVMTFTFLRVFVLRFVRVGDLTVGLTNM